MSAKNDQRSQNDQEKYLSIYKYLTPHDPSTRQKSDLFFAIKKTVYIYIVAIYEVENG
jgi:hypothetical protein